MLSYCALATYDIMATRVSAPGRVKWIVAAVSGMAGFAFSNFLGFHLLTGGAVRYRIYARLGLDGADIAKIILLTWSGLWLAITGLIATAVIVTPYGIPFIHLINPLVDRIAGVAALLGIVWLFFYAGVHGREFRLFGWRLSLPGRGPLFLQLVAGLIDIAGATYALYVLVPPDLQPGFPAFLVIYLSAVLIAVVSHVPGGVGIFEVTMMAALGASGRADILAALLAYRIVYYVTPFVVAAVLLAITEAGWLKQRLGTNFGTASQVHASAGPARRVGHRVSFRPRPALLGLDPQSADPAGRIAPVAAVARARDLAFPRRASPVSACWSSHRACAAGSTRPGRQPWARWRLACVLTLTKGFDWDETLVMIAGLVALFIFRGAFYRRRPEPLMVLSPSWLALLGVTRRRRPLARLLLLSQRPLFERAVVAVHLEGRGAALPARFGRPRGG